jgi:phenylalanyl-tRNA synthetase beta chain
MPTIEISLKDIGKLAGKKLLLSELQKALQYVKGEVESSEGDKLKLEIADNNRPDLWSAEGIARELRTRYTKESGLAKFPVKKSGLKVIVEKSMQNVRPKTVCAVVKGLKIDDDVLFQMIQLQEKICDTFGRKRKEVALGVYDYNKISPPVYFRAYSPEEIKFVPLDFNNELSLKEILEQHPKGKEYAHLLSGSKKYPIFIDSMDHVLSMPPIINSDFSGKVTKDTKDVFIECSGFNMKFLMPALNIMVSALADRGGKVETVDVIYPNGKIQTPDFTPKKINVYTENVKKLSGLDIKADDIRRLLLKARYGAKISGDKLEVFVPSYRQDVLHEVDVIEDVMISYGYNNIEPLMPRIASIGKLTEMNLFSKKIADIMVGLGAQEILSYTLTNMDNLVKKMNIGALKTVEIENPVSKNWCVFRTWITPSLMEFLSNNTNKEYPQNIFEMGEVVIPDAKAQTRSRNPVMLAWAYAGSEANFTKAKQYFDFLMRTLGLEYVIEESEHSSFILGRTGIIYAKDREIAYLGEMHPRVLSNFGIEQPVCSFEINLSEILDVIKK